MKINHKLFMSCDLSGLLGFSHFLNFDNSRIDKSVFYLRLFLY